MDYSVVIPLYNEDKSLKLLYQRVKNVMANLPGDYEILFVDDGSTDSSYQLLKELAFSDKTVKVISFVRNFGHHRAVVAGLLEAEGDYIITMDADLQNPPEEIPKLLEKAREGFDMVSGYRKLRKDSFSRRLPSLLINRLISAISGLKMNDYGSMLRVFKRETARGLAEAFRRNEGYITMLVAKVTRNVAELEVGHDQRHSGESKYGLRKLSSAFFRIFCYSDSFARLLGKGRKGPLFIIGKRIEDGKETTVST